MFDFRKKLINIFPDVTYAYNKSTESIFQCFFKKRRLQLPLKSRLQILVKQVKL